ncbi:hypothetical protein [Rossellomorea vietnamensis]|uniref:DUF1643 domain-containing protein n=1 Tax=Rossellomorea vietnamensis TaxID=218284 RepID=A0A0P6VTQ2_9BACI|nr:hypothetical protein [Rossellomorea vietnamensis]KPL57700.1 hypothetical protein AM506_20635 [Rossellomorea vietnamensis]
MTQLIPENIIGQSFTTYAAFYDVRINHQITWRFRRLLQIVHTDTDTFNGESHLPEKVEATFILMNPGSADPISKDAQVVNATSLHTEVPYLELSHPDKAQFQIMRLMQLKGWKKIQVINLSDIKTANSVEFYSKFKEFEKKYSDVHSIFSEQRTNELISILDLSSSGPIIVAWGTNSNLISLASKAICQLPNDKVIGISNNLYYHASPQKHEDKIKWLAIIQEEL